MAAKTKTNDYGDVIFSEEDAIDLLYNDPKFDISKLYFNDISIERKHVPIEQKDGSIDFS